MCIRDRVGYQPERAASAQLEMRNLHASVDAANHESFFAPVKLECFAQLETQGNKGVRGFAFLTAPGADEGSELAVAAYVTFDLDSVSYTHLDVYKRQRDDSERFFNWCVFFATLAFELP